MTHAAPPCCRKLSTSRGEIQPDDSFSYSIAIPQLTSEPVHSPAPEQEQQRNPVHSHDLHVQRICFTINGRQSRWGSYAFVSSAEGVVPRYACLEAAGKHNLLVARFPRRLRNPCNCRTTSRRLWSQDQFSPNAIADAHPGKSAR